MNDLESIHELTGRLVELNEMLEMVLDSEAEACRMQCASKDKSFGLDLCLTDALALVEKEIACVNGRLRKLGFVAPAPGALKWKKAAA